MRLSSILQEIKSSTESRLRTPASTGTLHSVKKLMRSKGKDALRMSADQEETRKLSEKLDRAVEELGVRTDHLRLSSMLMSSTRSPPQYA
jgi:phage terminase large subunit